MISRSVKSLVSRKIDNMKNHISFILMLIVAIVCLNTTITIEVLNAKANYYLPRNDDCADGKWRISQYETPRDRLRGWVNGPGLLQYILAPLLLLLSIIQIKPNVSNIRKRISIICLVFSILCISVMVYRGYFSSLCT